ncbi:MAG TPA: hypothetical protein VEH84_11010 [Alphaproteobacteria bacterium]|nr:hypothetical protein [Alphaproteobacteria bacterium]
MRNDRDPHDTRGAPADAGRDRRIVADPHRRLGLEAVRLEAGGRRPPLTLCVVERLGDRVLIERYTD